MRRLLVAAAIGATAVLAFTSPAQAHESHDLSGWNTTDTRSAGHFEVTNEGLHIWTDDATSNAKVAAYYPTSFDLADTGTPSLDWTGTTPPPGLQLAIAKGADTGILVGEAVYGDNWWLSNGSADALKTAAPHHGGGQGSDNWGTLAEWADKTGAKVTAVGFSLGSGIKGNGTIHSMTFAGEKYTFTPKPPQTKPEPKKCEAYLYTGTTQNLCAAGLPETGKVNCADVKYRVTLVNAAVDPWGLDGNRGTKGVGCESNPLKPKPSPTTSPAAPAQAAALPVTGTPVKTFAAVAAGGVLLGAVALLVSRRRRTRFTA